MPIGGTKPFITNASVAGFAVVMAGAGERKLTAFGVMRGTPGFAAGKPEEKMGLHASDTAPLLLQGCRVPERDRIGRDGEAFDDVKKVLDRGRIGIGALAIGLGRASLELAIRYAKERTQFGRAIAEFQMIQWKLARARTELDAARLLVHRAAALADAGRPFTDAASKAKLFASQAGTRAADASLQVLGGYGYLRDFPVERHLRAVRLMEIGEGTSEGQRIFIRSMASRGHAGGLARATARLVNVLDALGNGVVIVETVGVGQEEVDVVSVADTVCLVTVPGLGDDIQAIKAGVLEIADVLVVNKADRPGADDTVRDLAQMLSLAKDPSWKPPIVRTAARSGEGIEQLVDAIAKHRAWAEESGARTRRRREAARSEVLTLLREALLRRLEGRIGDARLDAAVSRVADRRLDPYAAVDELLRD